MSITELIDRTIEILRRDGWTVGRLEKTEGVVYYDDAPAFIDAPIGAKCLFGAWNTARHGSPRWPNDFTDETDEAFIAALGFEDNFEAINWNNSRDSVAPVIARLEEARERAEVGTE